MLHKKAPMLTEELLRFYKKKHKHALVIWLNVYRDLLRVQRNCGRRGLQKHQVLGCAFIWSSAPEGHSYWMVRARGYH